MSATPANESENATRALVRAAAIARPDPARRALIGECAGAITDWAYTGEYAETHNMSPLLHAHLKDVDNIAALGRRLLGALAVRHRGANATLSSCASEIIRVFAERGIETVVLKGMALAHSVYPEPRLRPMRDIDLLVPAALANDAQTLLGEIGYDLPEGFDFGLDGGRYMRNHHHLPIASLQRDGMTVSVELHTDALSGDYPESLSFDRVRADARPFMIEDTPALAMGHDDMLTHLLRHALEPAEEIRLGGVADIVSYATLFNDEIDWQDMRQRRPYVTNAIRMLHHIAPLPEPLAPLRPETESPAGAGFGMRPLGTIVSAPAPWTTRIREMSAPPPWWLYAYYGAPDTTPPWRLRWLHHGPRLGRWLFRRLRSAVGG